MKFWGGLETLFLLPCLQPETVFSEKIRKWEKKEWKEVIPSNVCPYHVGRQVEENSIIEASSPAHTSYLYLVPGVPSF